MGTGEVVLIAPGAALIYQILSLENSLFGLTRATSHIYHPIFHSCETRRVDSTSDGMFSDSCVGVACVFLTPTRPHFHSFATYFLLHIFTTC
jgi:hypothetical protein